MLGEVPEIERSTEYEVTFEQVPLDADLLRVEQVAWWLAKGERRDVQTLIRQLQQDGQPITVNTDLMPSKAVKFMDEFNATGARATIREL